LEVKFVFIFQLFLVQSFLKFCFLLCRNEVWNSTSNTISTFDLTISGWAPTNSNLHYPTWIVLLPTTLYVYNEFVYWIKDIRYDGEVFEEMWDRYWGIFSFNWKLNLCSLIFKAMELLDIEYSTWCPFRTCPPQGTWKAVWIRSLISHSKWAFGTLFGESSLTTESWGISPKSSIKYYCILW